MKKDNKLSKQAEAAAFAYQRELTMLDGCKDELLSVRRMAFKDGYLQAIKDFGLEK